ncbi:MULTISPECIES: aminotransferase [unclassified Streptococcus]|uniref:aminotransferase n=1 Tax=unclassified Streptococcus TaxID=2608887 RepID=UPI0010727F5A|nr:MULTISPECIES: aminotransferase [unclassified Streptococcus]MBF0787949.1 aminotransferase [Streptococcus sp. 19428wC2_LYSM12]MCQ9210988.1 aminotransferase [Streptococcus sp. B01]MCQ9214259.1 aminotransferase [Streptococcus sp. O1]TFV05002.1 aminotransferase [Streptococcus sp. LYSM12]
MEIARFGVEEWLNEWEAQAVYDIAGSSIDSLTLAEVLALGGSSQSAFLKDLWEKKMNYGWIEGSPTFKEEVRKLYQNVELNQILQTNGATGANHLVLYALIESGDHVISLYPSYQQLYDIPRSLGADVSLWQIRESESWLPSLDELRTLMRPNTKIICINNANNPTGAVMERSFLEELVAIAREVGAYILSDEVYKPLEEHFDVPAIVDLYEKGISVNSMSKTYSVAGVRVGWVVANDELSQCFRKYRDYTMICAGVVDDALATYVLQHKEAVLARNRALVTENLTVVKDWVEKETRVSLVYPSAVPVSFIKLEIPEETETFCLRLLKEKGVLLVPGNRFDCPGYARLGYCTQTSILKKGLALVSEFLKQYD